MKITMVDFSAVINSVYRAGVEKFSDSGDEKLKMYRYMLLDAIGEMRRKFDPDELILALDNSSWRQDYFKYYKAKRKMDKVKSDFDYKEFYDLTNILVEEIKENFPYKVIEVKKAEGDDVISILSAELHEDNEIVIVSRDKDFKQLQRYKNVKQYEPVKKDWLKCEDAYLYQLEQILVGDGTDGVPNILSPDNIFVDEGKRQKSITKKIRSEFFEDYEKFIEENNLKENFERNKKLVIMDKENIPDDIWNSVVEQYYNYETPVADFMKITGYLSKHKIRDLKGKVSSFL